MNETFEKIHLTADNKIFIAQLPLVGKHWIVFGHANDNDLETREFKTYKEAYAYANSMRCHTDYLLKSKIEFN